MKKSILALALIGVLAFASAGFAASGLDLAQDMLAQARQNAARLRLQARFLKGRLETLPAPFPPQAAGLVLCLGNTLPHLLRLTDLKRAFAGIGALLAPKGLAVVQTLNYDRILKRRERLVSVDRADEATFVRFYDFVDERHLRFNLLRVTWDRDQAHPEPLLSVTLRPYRARDLLAAARAAGLDVAICAGDAALTPFDPASSETVLLALRQGGALG